MLGTCWTKVPVSPGWAAAPWCLQLLTMQKFEPSVYFFKSRWKSRFHCTALNKTLVVLSKYSHQLVLAKLPTQASV